ncbi:MAG: indole-3-glycerol phosphate synthase TrpC [Candidatus Abyssubacteria bacterium]
MILGDIIRHKRLEVEASKKLVPPAELQLRVVPRSPCLFRQALSVAGQLSLIAEIKKASPSRGVLRADFDPAALARAYAEGGASALSVLTDTKYFQGEASHLKVARESARLPTLRKDFIIDEYQVWESAAIGADALLLIVAALEDHQLRDYLGLASELGLDALVEVHDRGQLERALGAGAEIIGINNRDLRTFETDIGVTLKLAPQVPDGHIIVSESGIHTGEDARKLRGVGVNAILVGEALMTSWDIAKKIRELTVDESQDMRDNESR